jgi:hypothetical protein
MSADRKALMPMAGEFLHQLLHLPDDVHIVGVTWERVYDRDIGNLVLELEAFSDDEFPSERVSAQFHEQANVTTGRYDTIFDGWVDVE